MGKGKGLKSALHSQQSRLKERAKNVTQAARIAERIKLRRKLKGHVSDSPRGTAKTTIPFNPTDRILLVGEGNFSFTHALVDDPPGDLAALHPGNITATAYDTEEVCYGKYPESQLIVSSLRESGVEIIFGVDATLLERHARLKGRRWDRIVWNFPHAGKGIADQDRNILTNQVLILGFFRSAAKILQVGRQPCLTATSKWKSRKDDDDEDDVEDEGKDRLLGTRGTVLITLRNVVPYTLWDVPRLAKTPPSATGSQPPNPRYTLLRSFQFQRSVWKGYEHRMTKGERAHGTGTTGEDRTWEFYTK